MKKIKNTKTVKNKSNRIYKFCDNQMIQAY